MDPTSLLLLASLCSFDTRHLYTRNDTVFTEPLLTGIGMEPLSPVFGPYRVYEFLYKTEFNRPYRWRVAIPDFAISHGFKVPNKIVACTAVG